MEKQSKDAELELTVQADYSGPVQAIYCNYASISHTPHDFRIDFAQVEPVRPDAVSQIKKSGILKAPIRVSITIPVSLVEPLIGALKTNYERFNESKKQKK